MTFGRLPCAAARTGHTVPTKAMQARRTRSLRPNRRWTIAAFFITTCFSLSRRARSISQDSLNGAMLLLLHRQFDPPPRYSIGRAKGTLDLPACARPAPSRVPVIHVQNLNTGPPGPPLPTPVTASPPGRGRQGRRRDRLLETKRLSAGYSDRERSVPRTYSRRKAPDGTADYRATRPE
jgi:hypothetical protein